MPFDRPFITCVELVELVTDAKDGALPFSMRAHYELHLASCSDCRAYVSQFEGTLKACSALSPAPATRPVVPARALEWLRARKETK